MKENEPSIEVTLSDIFRQGQETQHRVTRLESVVTDLVVVNKRLNDHAGRLREAERKIAVQALDSVDAQTATEEIAKLWAAVHRMSWMPLLGMAVITAAGGAFISRLM